MKILKYIVITILVIVAAFFLLGMVKSSVSYGHEITVNKPVYEAWSIAQDESKFDQWLTGFKSIELLSGEKGKVGSTYKVVVNPGQGQPEFVMTETIVSIKENDHIEFHFDSEMMDFHQKMIFTAEGDQSKIRTESRVEGKGMMMKSMFALMEMTSGAFQAQEEINIENLKKVVEGN